MINNKCDYQIKLLELYLIKDKEFNILTARERKVLSLYYGLDGHPKGTLTSIGEYFCLSRERIRQIIYKAIKKITTFLIKEFAQRL